MGITPIFTDRESQRKTVHATKCSARIVTAFKSISMRGALIIVLALLGACGRSAPRAVDTTSPTLPLTHSGRWITDAQGRVVILHGMNMVNKLPPYTPDAVGFDDDDAAFLAAEGYNTVRVGVIYKAVEPSPGVYDDDYIDRIVATINTLGRHGIVSLLDFHQDLYNEKFGGEGLPDWAVQDDGLPNQPQVNFSLNYFLEPGLNAAFDNFWNNSIASDGFGLQDHHASAWTHIAQRFSKNANVFGYDLFNEPWPGTQIATCLVPLVGCPVFDTKLTLFYRREIAAIRKVDPRTMIWYEPNLTFDFGIPTNIGELNDVNTGFGFHDYCLAEPETNTNLGCGPFDDIVFSNALGHAESSGGALLLTEFGATSDADHLSAVVNRADANMVGWQEWAYCFCNDPTTSTSGAAEGIVLDPSKPLSGSNLNAGNLEVLSRPYPQIIAGTPKSFGFDASNGSFSLDYSAARVDGQGTFPEGTQTVIVLPVRQYPSGYAVTVHGAKIVSAPNAPYLQLASCSGATEISVAVSKSGNASQSCGS